MKTQPYLNSWKTTAGAIGKAACMVAIMCVAMSVEDPERLIMSLVALYAGLDVTQGIVARDADKSSQDAGIRG